MNRRAALRTDPAKARAWQERSRRRLPKVGAKARREQAALAAMRTAVHQRSGGWCEVATPACPLWRHPAADVHHVFTSDRDRGVHDPERALHVCRQAHDWFGRYPREAEARGWVGRSGR